MDLPRSAVELALERSVVSQGKRGRPRKFARPSRVVALTLPEDVVDGLRRLHPDIAWAIVTLFEKRSSKAATVPQRDTDLVTIADGRSLIVVRRKAFTRLQGIQIIPLDRDKAFLALEPGRGMADLELAVIDRLANQSIRTKERAALTGLQTQLRKWRRNRALRFHSRAIIVVEGREGDSA